MQLTDQPSLKELEASRQKSIENIQEAEKHDDRPGAIRLLKTGLKHIEDMIQARSAAADG